MTHGTLFDIQHYAVHDGPGIRTLVFFKGCPLNCEWCCNPESKSFFPQLRYFDFRCTKCLMCTDVCKWNAVTIQNQSLVRSFDLCKKCERKPCVENCAQDALQHTGKMYSVPEVVNIVSKDIPFYNNSGGGVTFSGGEPFSQPEFLLELLKECKAKNIHTAVETCGCCDKADIEKSIELVDLYLYDLKLMNDDQHRKFTGKSNEKILENLRFLAASGKDIMIRFPMIPGITDATENIEAIAHFMKSIQLKNICLEPYHTFGVEKYNELGVDYTLPDLKNYNAGTLNIIKDIFSGKGFICEIA